MNALSTARGLWVQGARPGDVMQIPATASLANLGWAYYKACHHYLGILPVTTGSGVVTPSRRQLEIAFDWGTNLWMSFPEYMTQLAAVCRDDLQRDLRELDSRFVTTFLGPDTEGKLRAQLEEAWGCPVYDNYGTHEMGLGATECQHQAGLHLSEDLIYVEVLGSETGEPAAVGQPGNLVVTILYRRIPPFVRFNVRDLVRVVSEERCACGSEFRRIDHFLGRSDDMIKLRGVNVYPMACLNAVKADPRTTGEWICVVDRHNRDGVIRDEMTVRVELREAAEPSPDLVELIERRLQSDLGLRVSAKLVPKGSIDEVANLHREGKPRRLLDRRFRT